jgi:galactokinase
MKASHQKAGVKINGGGFAGSVIALVPKDELKNVIDAAKEKYGKENIHLVDVRNDTPCELI